MTLGFVRTIFLFSILLFSSFASAEDAATPAATSADAKAVETAVTEAKNDAVKEVAGKEEVPAIPDMKNGEELYKKCALCHGQYAQGTLGGLYPRLAGLPKHYLLSQMEKYIDGSRSNGFSIPMLIIGGMKDMNKSQLDDLASYMASIDINKHYPFKIPEQLNADLEKGKEIFMDDCKSCHGKWAQGVEKKKSPPLAGQYPEYLMRETDFFKDKSRHHDNDPDDETFDDYSKEELTNLFAYASTIPYSPENGYFKAPEAPAKPVAPSRPAAPEGLVDVAVESSGNTKTVKIESVTQTVLKMALKDGMTAAEAAEAMLSKATEQNMKNVGHQQVSKELKARGIETGHLEIFQFCNPEDAMKMVKFNTIFAAYMPCRIALVEDAQGKLWLEMLNLDMLINSVKLPPELEKIAIETNGTMLDILTAGATGNF